MEENRGIGNENSKNEFKDAKTGAPFFADEYD
jgi:hypothetical protein